MAYECHYYTRSYFGSMVAGAILTHTAASLEKPEAVAHLFANSLAVAVGCAIPTFIIKRYFGPPAGAPYDLRHGYIDVTQSIVAVAGGLTTGIATAYTLNAIAGLFTR